MKIAVIGTGYVGLTTGVCLASKGHEVTCVDVDFKKVEMINSGTSPIFEEGMDELLKKVLKEKLLKAALDMEGAVKEAEVVFLCVGTPSMKDGSINLDYIKTAAEQVSHFINFFKVIVVKSTVVPNTTTGVVKKILDKHCIDYGLCMNPEFLKEGTAIKDFLSGDRIVLGVDSSRTEDVMRQVYKDFSQKIFVTNPETAEMIKYANNSFLATKISFANEIGNLCKKMNIDSYEVMDGVGMDKRICRSFLDSGAGFGGSCFPKDVKALVNTGVKMGEEMELLKSVLHVNELQPLKMIELLKKHINPKGKNIGILGLAFKKGTDDIREAPSIAIIDELLRLGAKVSAYDPKAMETARRVYKDKVSFAKNKEELVNRSDAVLIVTDWDEFKDVELYKGKLVIDGRRIRVNAKIYEGICW